MLADEKSMSWTVSDVMTKDAASVGHAAELVASAVATTTPGTSLANAASLMFQHRIQRLPVVDSENRPVGIISRTQLLKVFLRSDELIRREIVRIVHDVAAVKGNHVEVDVTDGLVSLRGEVETRNLLGSLIQRIAGVPGVLGVKIEELGALSERQSGASAVRARA
jgi:CBS domain-containing protein